MRATIALLLVSALTAVAGTLRDDANLFGPDRARVEAALGSSQVWVESMVKRPDDLKSYADTRIAQLGDGFIIVITTQPKAWRISMSPPGLAASPRTEAVGNKMASTFKQGRMADGVIAAARELTALTKPTGKIESPPMAAGTKFVLLVGIAIVGLCVICLIWYFVRAARQNARDRQAEEARKAQEEEERLARLRRDRREERQAEQKKWQRPSGGIGSAPLPGRAAPTPKPPPQPPPQEPNPYENMTPAQRREVVHHYVHDHRYNDGLLNDPLAFYLFMNAVQPRHETITMQQQPAFTPPPAPAFTPAPRHRDPDPEPELERSSRSYSRPEPSRSDESGSSGSYSSDSSSDSGSSSSGSDSSGSGGDF